MDEFELIKNYFQKLTKNNPSALKLNDDVFFDKKNKLVLSLDTYNEDVHYLNFKYAFNPCNPPSLPNPLSLNLINDVTTA